MNHIEKLNPRLSRGKALDFGCGPGRLTQALATYFDLVYGVDIAPSFLELARAYNRFGERCTYRLNEVDDLSVFGDQTFDLVYSARVLMHMNSSIAKNYIREFIRLLRPDGILVFQIPSRYTYRIKRGDTGGTLFSIYVPNIASDFYRKVKSSVISHRLQMEVHGIGKKSVVSLIQESKARVLEIVRDDKVPGWEDFCYYCSPTREAKQA